MEGGRATKTLGEGSGTEPGDWLSVLTDAFRGDEATPPVDVAFDSGSERIQLRLEAGRLEVAEPDSPPDLVIRLSEVGLREALLGKVSSLDLFEDMRIEAGGGERRLAPWAETQVPATGQFTRIPAATLSVGIHVIASPVGQLGILERWEDGALISSEVVGLGELESSGADVHVSCPLAQLGALRRGELTPLDALADGMGMGGEWPQLMCFVELVQHPAYRAAWPSDPSLDAEAAWGAVFCSPAYGDAAVRAMLEPIQAPGARP
jgi:hypothetical protein